MRLNENVSHFKSTPIGKREGYIMKTFRVGNEFGTVCVVSDCGVNCEQDALDWAVDEGYLDGDIMADCDVQEAIKDGWGDDIAYAGNYGLPLRTDYLWIEEVSK